MTVYRPRCGTVRGPYCGPAPKSKKHCQGTDEYQNGASYVDHLQLLLYTFGSGAGGLLLYISVLVPGLTAIHFCSGAGACCYTLLALVPGLAAIHFYSGAGACCYTFLMLWDVFGAHVVGRVRGLCCGTCSGPMLWDVFRAHVVNVFGASFP